MAVIQPETSMNTPAAVHRFERTRQFLYISCLHHERIMLVEVIYCSVDFVVLLINNNRPIQTIKVRLCTLVSALASAQPIDSHHRI